MHGQDGKCMGKTTSAGREEVMLPDEDEDEGGVRHNIQDVTFK